MIDGDLAPSWRSPAVHDALDLCLSCKGCASDCPTGIDMAAYKAEVLHQSYKGRLRPRSHYSLGRLPKWSRLASRMPRVANRMTNLPGVRRIALWLAGVDARRSIPAFADQTFRRWFAAQPVPSAAVSARPVILFVDCFTNHFSPGVARAAVSVLRAAGYEPSITSESACCGLTWISTGQLDAARRILGHTVAELRSAAEQGVPIVGLEPSCTGVLRSDVVELLDNDDARLISKATVTVAELLTATPGWTPPSLAGVSVIAQPHCHHHAVMGWEADAKLLSAAGATVKRLGGCCGLAGNFGVEQGHYEVSVQVAEQQLLPALREAAPDDVFLADGFSCRTQSDDLAGVAGVHLVELLARAASPGQ
jgi:Fe-S oxidoreductase